MSIPKLSITTSESLPAAAPIAIVHSTLSERMIQAVKSRIFSPCKTAAWQKEVTQITPKVLSEELETTVKALMFSEDPLKAMEDLASLFSLEQLQDAIRSQYPEHQDAFKTAQAMLKSAQSYLEKIEPSHGPTMQMQLQAVVNTGFGVLENFIAAFGVVEFVRLVENELEGAVRTKKLLTMFQLLGMLMTAISHISGKKPRGLFVGVPFFILCSSFAYSFFRPSPSHLPLGENWTDRYLEGRLAATNSRALAVADIGHTLTSSSRPKKHPLLIGKSGVGKTETVKSFIASVERGDYPALKGKKVFYFNTADLTNHTDKCGSGNTILSTIREKIGSHEEDIVLVFDEVHVACQKKSKGQAKLAEQLKTLLDPGQGNFAYVIGVTTEEEYLDMYLNDSAFLRRFKKILIPNMKPEETLEALKALHLQEASHILVAQGALQYLLKQCTERFPDQPQPFQALNLLQMCIDKTEVSQRTPLDEKVEKIRQKIQSFYSEKTIGQGDDLLPYGDAQERKEIKALEEELTSLEQMQKEQMERLKTFFLTRNNLADIKTPLFQTVIEISQFHQEALSSKEKNKAGAFLLLSHYWTRLLKQWVVDEGKALGITTLINQALIDTVISEELATHQREKNSVERAKEQIAKRAT